jgi:hypothetical protein
LGANISVFEEKKKKIGKKNGLEFSPDFYFLEVA